ncbi:MAG: DNA gyrase subunit A [Clostridia bacterium]|nr:DNA gyrase subunit A [Clostridia bacterium]
MDNENKNGAQGGVDKEYEHHHTQHILDVDIKEEVKKAYIDYSMSVIVGRALPDVRDGLKPVHRRILYAMHEDKLTYDNDYRKSATTVGNVLGRYHPHGDAAVYDTMVRMAQSFSLRYPLIDGQGNFGTIDGDKAAAYRYTESRMTRISNLMLSDIEKNVVDFLPNFDNTRKEPEVLPCRFPNLLVNGTIGIAVGMATNVPPHNMCEVIDALYHLIDNPDCTVPDLMQFIKGPDFPTAGTLYGVSGVYEAYMTGRGRAKVRAAAHFEEKHGRTSIIVTELPYQVNRGMLLQNMAELVKTKRLEGISDIRNESDRKKGMRIVIDVKKDANPQIVLNNLYKMTQLQDTIPINMLALVNGEPKTLNLKEVLTHYLRHQEEVIVRRTRFDLAKAEKAAHIYEGYKKALDFIEEIIKTIRASASIADSKVALMERFGFSDVQAQAIVEMQLGRLSGMERQKIEDTLNGLYAQIAEYKAILADGTKVTAIIKDDLAEVKERFGDERRTRIETVDNEILDEDLIERVNSVVTVTHGGYIKRLPADTYQAQHRGGKGLTGMTTKEEDFVEQVIVSHSHSFLLMFSNLGRVYRKKCYEIPESGRTAKGTHLANVLQLAEGEKITSVIPVEGFNENEYLVMVTKLGVIKRISLIEYQTRRTGGLFAINLDEGDELWFVLKTHGNDCVIVATHLGRGIRFEETDARSMGRQARGVKCMTLEEGDFIVGASVISEDAIAAGAKIITVSEYGYGKRCEFDEFKIQSRGGKGICCHKLSEKTGNLAGISVVYPGDDVMLITDSGIIIRFAADEIPVYGRATGGVIVMRTGADARIIGFAAVKPEEDEEETEGEVNEETSTEETVEE